MKLIGVVRKVDEFGRIVFFIEFRRIFDIVEKDVFEIFVDGDKIIFRKYELVCIFCGNVKDVIYYKGKNICKDCMDEFKKS